MLATASSPSRKRVPLMEELFDYRFNADSNLGGHSLGNLLLAALYEKRGGFQEGLEAAAEILAVSGRVVPVSNNIGLVLMGETASGRVLKGESAVGHAPDPLRRIWLEPAGAVANEAALEAIRQAELIVIGPGSLYTSIIPNFLLPEIGEAVAASQAPTVFVCNVATQPYETDGFGAAEHLMAFQAHSGVSVSHVVVNSKTRDLPPGMGPGGCSTRLTHSRVQGRRHCGGRGQRRVPNSPRPLQARRRPHVYRALPIQWQAKNHERRRGLHASTEVTVGCLAVGATLPALLSVASLELLAASARALFVPANLPVLPEHESLSLAVGAGTRRGVLGVPGGPYHR